MSARRAEIHPAAAAGFGRSAEAYERGRPGYPDAAVDRLVAALPGRRVVDLAAGTGKLTRALVARGCDVVAVEPVAEMRALIAPPARAVEGVAEATGLPDASADAVTVAQAFHWFDGPRALAEIHRVLRPGGVLALIWNRRDTHRRAAAPAHGAARAAARRRAGPPRRRLARGDRGQPAVRAAARGDVRQRAGRRRRRARRPGRLDQLRRARWARPQRAALLADVRALADGGTVTLRYVVELQLAERVP